MKLRVFITGGTVDKEYNLLNGELVFIETRIPKMLGQGRSKVDIEYEVIMLKDSLDMNDNDRKTILGKCKKAKENKIVITHGTDTMARTAKALGRAKLNKTIVLTGAMVPYTVFGSDALFNLGCAVTASQILPLGVYIAMNGKIFSWDNVQKNKKRGEFVSRK